MRAVPMHGVRRTMDAGWRPAGARVRKGAGAMLRSGQRSLTARGVFRLASEA
ncbi:hypothetical protein DM40_743 [Burkholderia cenocepacia]|nr:hypothetical protein DM40_743 [Burkholderia cenocepacia]